LSLIYGNEQISQSERGLFYIVDSQQMGVLLGICTDHNVSATMMSNFCRQTNWKRQG